MSLAIYIFEICELKGVEIFLYIYIYIYFFFKILINC